MAKKKRHNIRYKKRYRGNGTRNYKDARYVKFRREVRSRDDCICQMCNKKLIPRWTEIHHILPWSSYPSLRFNVNNGICLCSRCHKSIKGKEMNFVKMFSRIVDSKRK